MHTIMQDMIHDLNKASAAISSRDQEGAIQPEIAQHTSVLLTVTRSLFKMSMMSLQSKLSTPALAWDRCPGTPAFSRYSTMVSFQDMDVLFLEQRPGQPRRKQGHH